MVLALASLALLTALGYSVSWMGAEEARSVVYQVQTFMQLARVEAITRNRACRFELDQEAHRIRIWDLNNPADTTDDLLLSESEISSRVTFGDPEGGPAVTLASLGGKRYHATFGSSGGVSAGSGSVSIRGRDRFQRISLYGAGGTRVERWSGETWQVGP